ncbi:unnamed protein product [Vicia faba]|uniref:Uncharacterized protein n=1 Tax=Vicia faba TaxID=3906 RepID=A0AAV0YKA4_VICFA|nr:unnamed protein product [Vicia faba]
MQQTKYISSSNIVNITASSILVFEIFIKTYFDGLSGKRRIGQVRQTEAMKQSRKLLGFPEDSACQTQNSHKFRSRSLRILKEKSNLGEKASQGNMFFSGPLQVSTSNASAWVKSQKDNTSLRSDCRTTSRGHSSNALDSSALNSRNKLDTCFLREKILCPKEVTEFIRIKKGCIRQTVRPSSFKKDKKHVTGI